MTFSAQVCAPHIYLFLSQGIWIDFFCPALFFHKSLKSRAETSSHLPHLAEILLVWMCHTALKCTQRWPRLLVGHGWKQQTLHWACAKKVHEMFIKLNHSLEGEKKLFSSPHGTVYIVDFLFLWFPPCDYFSEFMMCARQ